MPFQANVESAMELAGSQERPGPLALMVERLYRLALVQLPTGLIELGEQRATQVQSLERNIGRRSRAGRRHGRHRSAERLFDRDDDRSVLLDPRARARGIGVAYGASPRVGHHDDGLPADVRAALEAYANGAVIAGSSAGAMVMCEFYYDPHRGQVVDGLNLVPNGIVMPHYNTFGKSWASRLLEISEVTLIGIDERTGMIDDSTGTWTVYGAGNVTLYRNQDVEIYVTGKSFSV